MDEAQAAFNLASLQYALAFYRSIWPSIGDKCGLLQIAHSPAEAKLQELLRDKFSLASELVRFVSAEEAADLAGTRLGTGGLFFPDAGWIDPRRLCNWLVAHPNIRLQFNATISDLKALAHGWQATIHSGNRLTASVIVIASAGDSSHLEQLNHLPLRKIRGQISRFVQTAQSPALSSVVCAEGYVAPAQDGFFCTGATFHPNDPDTSLRVADHQTNLDNLYTHLPDFAGQINTDTLEGRVGYRCSLPDYLPCVGPAPALEPMLARFERMRKNTRAGFIESGAYLPGLFVNIGHGARGLWPASLAMRLIPPAF
jgi:tRNA 5-methylaminomethyl-2-thiouridine biosynthesis bifunctional protein